MTESKLLDDVYTSRSLAGRVIMINVIKHFGA